MSLIGSASPRLFGWLAEASLFCVYILFVVWLVSYDSLEVFLILSFYSGFSSQDCCIFVVSLLCFVSLWLMFVLDSFLTRGMLCMHTDSLFMCSQLSLLCILIVVDVH